MKKKPKRFSFEEACAELEKIVEQLEQGGIALEDALKQFERGMSLVRDCQAVLRETEQKVQVLLHSHEQLTPFELKNETTPE